MMSATARDGVVKNSDSKLETSQECQFNLVHGLKRQATRETERRKHKRRAIGRPAQGRPNLSYKYCGNKGGHTASMRSLMGGMIGPVTQYRFPFVQS